jgi:hypothetical protein
MSVDHHHHSRLKTVFRHGLSHQYDRDFVGAPIRLQSGEGELLPSIEDT